MYSQESPKSSLCPRVVQRHGVPPACPRAPKETHGQALWSSDRRETTVSLAQLLSSPGNSQKSKRKPALWLHLLENCDVARRQPAFVRSPLSYPAFLPPHPCLPLLTAPSHLPASPGRKQCDTHHHGGASSHTRRLVCPFAVSAPLFSLALPACPQAPTSRAYVCVCTRVMSVCVCVCSRGGGG